MYIYITFTEERNNQKIIIEKGRGEEIKKLINKPTLPIQQLKD